VEISLATHSLAMQAAAGSVTPGFQLQLRQHGYGFAQLRCPYVEVYSLWHRWAAIRLPIGVIRPRAEITPGERSSAVRLLGR